MKAKPGAPMLLLWLFLYLAATALLVLCAIRADKTADALSIIGIVLCSIYLCIGWFPWLGLKVIRPNEALVLTFFGKYVGTLKKEGFYYVNPFCSAANPLRSSMMEQAIQGVVTQEAPQTPNRNANRASMSSKISLKTISLVNRKQKVNDEMGNPIEVGIVVFWRVVNTAKAVFNVDNYSEFLSTQADSALRDVVRQYPYDVSGNGDEASLRGSSQEVADHLCQELQKRVQIAGIEVVEARITHLAYAPEIAAAMLQRQQASAIIEARQKIVDGAVGMVEMALQKLSENDVCQLDEERKAAMVSNLLVVLCGNKDAQPIVNSGSIY